MSRMVKCRHGEPIELNCHWCNEEDARFRARVWNGEPDQLPRLPRPSAVGGPVRILVGPPGARLPAINLRTYDPIAPWRDAGATLLWPPSRDGSYSEVWIKTPGDVPAPVTPGLYAMAVVGSALRETFGVMRILERVIFPDYTILCMEPEDGQQQV